MNDFVDNGRYANDAAANQPADNPGHIDAGQQAEPLGPQLSEQTIGVLRGRFSDLKIALVENAASRSLHS